MGRWLSHWWGRTVRTPRAAAAVLPREITIRGQHVWVSAQRGGLIVRRRAGLTAWVPVCTLAWADIDTLEFDGGTLHASVRFTRGRRPLLARSDLSPDQWLVLRNAVAEWAAIDLAL